MRTLASHCRLSLPGASPSMPIGARTGPVSVSEPASIRAMRGAAPARAARLIPPIYAVPPPATAFTMSIQSMPPGNQIQMHCHETEEIFFILDGRPFCSIRCSMKAKRSATCRPCSPSRSRRPHNTTTPACFVAPG